jgi:hypothetical protein
MKTDLYVFRVNDIRTYLTQRYGAGRLIYDGHRSTKFEGRPHGATQGIIAFVWQGRWADFNASGHVDLYRGVLTGNPQTLGANCVGTCYFNAGPMLAYFWEMHP